MSEPVNLPSFRYHPDPVRSGSVTASSAKCRCCGKVRGFIYNGPVFAEKELEDALCPWCIADGKAAKKFDATFTDSEALADGIPEGVAKEICERTPGFNTWQEAQWPACCGDATAFIEPTGIAEIRATNYQLEGAIMSHVVHNLHVSGGAAVRLIDSLKREAGPTLFVFLCLKCQRSHFHIDQP